MKELHCDIGREAKFSGPSYFCLAESKTISANHAKIFWDSEQEAFFIKNQSKNKVSQFRSHCLSDPSKFPRTDHIDGAS